MPVNIPKFGDSLSEEQINFLKTFTKSCRKSILEMVTNASSGHPGGSLSSLDYLATLYAFIIGQTGEKIVISNGHISPGVYGVLAEMGYIPKEEVVKTFRKVNSIYEGHVTRHVPGIWYGTGPLGIGVSVASSFAWAEKYNKTNQKVYALMGDGECEEGQVHEMINFAKHHELNNLILFVDYNKVQLTDSLVATLNIDIKKIFSAADWNIIEIDAHNYEEIWAGISSAQNKEDKPVVILGHSIMGYGVDFMEKDGRSNKSDWHGKPPKPEQSKQQIENLTLTKDEENLIEEFRKGIKWHPKKAEYPKLLTDTKIDTGEPIIYEKENMTDCRTGYGKALLDLAKRNKNIVALTADLKTSVMTKFVSEELPQQYIECGIAEQHMVSASGGLSLIGFIPFCSTFGAFMTSRAKDQARVNDINCANVKMVATHCGLSVGEDGPTHQAIDDSGSFLGLFNTMTVEPVDPNHTDRLVRYIASHYGNFYMRMGRHKVPVITKEDGSIFYDENYKYEYGKCDIIRSGLNLTIATCGTTTQEAIKAREEMMKEYPEFSIEIIAVSSIKKFDDTLLESIKKTRKVITVEDHNPISGLGGQLARALIENAIQVEEFKSMGVTSYQLSGKPEELYKLAKIDSSAIKESSTKILSNKFPHA
ncbi:transketolase [Candidatus Peregrinibacteria bacterium]|nr:transketolase [Candidatus Peregrinibacteria bacterium]